MEIHVTISEHTDKLDRVLDSLWHMTAVDHRASVEKTQKWYDALHIDAHNQTSGGCS